MAKISTKAYVIAFADFRDKFFKDGSWSSEPLGAIYVDHINRAKDGDDDGWPNTSDGYDSIKAKHNLTRSKIKKDMLNLVHQEHNVTDFKSEPGKRKEPVTSHMSRDERRAYLEAVRMSPLDLMPRCLACLVMMARRGLLPRSLGWTC